MNDQPIYTKESAFAVMKQLVKLSALRDKKYRAVHNLIENFTKKIRGH